jgi:hypothetical protein
MLQVNDSAPRRNALVPVLAILIGSWGIVTAIKWSSWDDGPLVALVILIAQPILCRIVTRSNTMADQDGATFAGCLSSLFLWFSAAILFLV